ncbi:MAG: hypothetical protein WCF84_18800, partial [Anaerolineae bacterium]
QPGDRVYIVHKYKLRGYLPFVRIVEIENRAHHLFFGRFALVGHDAIAGITTSENIAGFAIWRYRWWDRQDERPFPNWGED